MPALAKSEPEALTRELLTIYKPALYIDNLVYAIGCQGSQVTQRWIDTLQGTPMLLPSLRYLMSWLPSNRTGEKIAWLEKYPDLQRNSPVDRIYLGWAEADEPAARRSLESLPAGYLRTGAAMGLATYYGASGTEEKAREIFEQYPELLTDRALVQWSSYVGISSPVLALEKIATIQDSEWRAQSYETILISWLAKDPDSARKWLQEHDLPDALRGRFPADR